MTATSALHRSTLGGWRCPDLRQEGGPDFWFEAQYEPIWFAVAAVANADTAACEAGSLKAVPIAHAEGTLPPALPGMTLVTIVPYWGFIAHLYPFGPVARKLLSVTTRSPP